MMQGCKQIREMIEYVMRDKQSIMQMTQSEKSYTLGKRDVRIMALECRRPAQSRSMLIQGNKQIEEANQNTINTPPEKVISEEEDDEFLVVSPCLTSQKSSEKDEEEPINRALNFNNCENMNIVTLKIPGLSDTSRTSTPTKLPLIEKVPE